MHTASCSAPKLIASEQIHMVTGVNAMIAIIHHIQTPMGGRLTLVCNNNNNKY